MAQILSRLAVKRPCGHCEKLPEGLNLVIRYRTLYSTIDVVLASLGAARLFLIVTRRIGERIGTRINMWFEEDRKHL